MIYPYLTDWFVDRAVEFIGSAKAKGRPFFLYLPFNAPHGPLQPPDRYLDRFQRLSPFRRRYVALIASLDEAVGKVPKEIDVQGLAEDTVVVFSSDNGDWGQPYCAGPGAKFRSGKGSLYEGGIRVPLRRCCKTPSWLRPAASAEGLCRPASAILAFESPASASLPSAFSLLQPAAGVRGPGRL